MYIRHITNPSGERDITKVYDLSALICSVDPDHNTLYTVSGVYFIGPNLDDSKYGRP